MTMITPSYLGETIEYSSLHACRSTLEDPTAALGDPHEVQRVTQAVRTRVRSEFSSTAMVESGLAAYRETIALQKLAQFA